METSEASKVETQEDVKKEEENVEECTSSSKEASKSPSTVLNVDNEAMQVDEERIVKNDDNVPEPAAAAAEAIEATTTTTAVNISDADDDDDDDDDYLSSKRLKIDEEDDEKQTSVASKSPDVQVVAEDIEAVSSTTVTTTTEVTEEPIADKETVVTESAEPAVAKTPSPLPPLVTFTIGDSTSPTNEETEAITTRIEENKGGEEAIEAISPPTVSTTESTDTSARSPTPTDSSLKVPPLKIICSKGDFSLVNDTESQKSSESDSNSSTASNGGKKSADLDVGSEEISSKKTPTESEAPPIKATIIIRKTADSETYEAASTAGNSTATTTTITTSTRSSSRAAAAAAAAAVISDTKPSAKRPATTQIVRNSSRNSLLASPVNEIIKPMAVSSSASSSALSSLTANNGAIVTATGAVIRRKLRSHTRQLGGSGALSPSNTTSNSSTDYVDQVNQEETEEIRKDSSSTADVTEIAAPQQSDDKDKDSASSVTTSTRKRKVRQQQASSENSNDASSVQAAAATTVVAATTTTTTTTATVTAAAATAATSSTQQPQKGFLNANNCIKQFVEIRNEIIKRRELLKQSSCEPKMPQNYEDFCLFKKNYLIKSNEEALFSIPFCIAPNQISEEMKELYTKQEKERYNLRIRQRVEQDKLLILYEHEVLRCFNQVCRGERKGQPYSFCTIIKDDEVYSVSHLNAQEQQLAAAAVSTEQQQSETTTNAIVDDSVNKYLLPTIKETLFELEQKFQKLKDDLIKRQLHESDSLHAVQLMDWQSKLKQLSVNNKLLNTNFNDMHVPIVTVNSKFELTPIKVA